MKKYGLTSLIFVCLGLYNFCHAQTFETISSDTIDSTVVIDENQKFTSFYADNSLGGTDYFEFDLDSKAWTAVTADGDILAGTIPQAVIDDYDSPELALPCFSSPVAFGVCGGLLILRNFSCEVRANNNVRRMAAACSAGGANLEIRSISGCGNVDARCVYNDGFGDDGGRDDGVDG